MHAAHRCFSFPWGQGLHAAQLQHVRLQQLRSPLSPLCGQELHAAQLCLSLPWGQELHSAQLLFNLPWGQGLHAAHRCFSFPWGQGLHAAQLQHVRSGQGLQSA